MTEAQQRADSFFSLKMNSFLHETKPTAAPNADARFEQATAYARPAQNGQFVDTPSPFQQPTPVYQPSPAQPACRAPAMPTQPMYSPPPAVATQPLAYGPPMGAAPQLSFGPRREAMSYGPPQGGGLIPAMPPSYGAPGGRQIGGSALLPVGRGPSAMPPPRAPGGSVLLPPPQAQGRPMSMSMPRAPATMAPPQAFSQPVTSYVPSPMPQQAPDFYSRQAGIIAQGPQPAAYRSTQYAQPQIQHPLSFVPPQSFQQSYQPMPQQSAPQQYAPTAAPYILPTQGPQRSYSAAPQPQYHSPMPQHSPTLQQWQAGVASPEITRSYHQTSPTTYAPPTNYVSPSTMSRGFGTLAGYGGHVGGVNQYVPPYR